MSMPGLANMSRAGITSANRTAPIPRRRNASNTASATPARLVTARMNSVPDQENSGDSEIVRIHARAPAPHPRPASRPSPTAAGRKRPLEVAALGGVITGGAVPVLMLMLIRTSFRV